VPNPEQGAGPLDQVAGSWGTIEFVTPDFLEPVRDAVNTFFSILINILNILLAVLEVLKVFIGAFLDPIIALIEAILALVQQILNDLRNAGLYIHGDFYLIKGPDFKELRGGFQAYEQRMITRLVDRRDPNRPNISNFSTCIAVFLYVGVDISNMQRLIRLINGILQLFNRNPPPQRTVGQATGIRASFGLEGASILTFGKGLKQPFKNRDQPSTPLNAMNISWQMAPVPGNFLTNFAQFAPQAFIVEVSTVRDGLPLYVDQQVDLATITLSQQPGKIKDAILLKPNNEPAFLTGGADQLFVDDLAQFNDSSNFQGEIKPDNARVYTAKSLADQAPIDLSQLKDGNKYYLQRAFYVSAGASAFYPGRGYGVTIPFADLPLDADWEQAGGGKVKRGKDVQPTSYYVRVRAVTKDIEDVEDYRYVIQNYQLRQPQPKARYKQGISDGDIGVPSFPFEVSFPGETTNTYLTCVQTALALMVLARTDVDVLLGKDDTVLEYPPVEGMKDADDTAIAENWNGFQGRARLRTGLEVKALNLMPRLPGKRKQDKFFKRNQVDPARFRRKLYNAALNMANDLIANNNPPISLQQAVITRCEALLNFTWGDALVPLPTDLVTFTAGSDLDPANQTILDALLSENSGLGIGLNTLSMGLDADTHVDEANTLTLENNLTTGFTEPRPHFFALEKGTFIDCSIVREQIPVFYWRGSQGTDIEYCQYIRNLIPDEVYAGAAFALQVAAGPMSQPPEQGWIAFRLFPQGLPDIDRFFDQILALLRAIQAAIQGLADLINKYIEMLQSRILELQQFLNRINAIIQQLLNLFISIPPTSGLVVVASGTDGVLSSLTLADNKPFDPPETYGGGVVLLAGGLPTIALELFKALFSSGD
jgi:hypothetical protein